MLVTTHAAVGYAVGRRSRSPSWAFALGLVSHFAMDTLPHWGDKALTLTSPRFLAVAVPDGLLALTLLTCVRRWAPERRRRPMLAAMIGAVLPDLDKPFALVANGRSPFPDLVNRFHSGMQNEAPDRLAREVAIAAALALVAIGQIVSRDRRHGETRTRSVKP